MSLPYRCRRFVVTGKVQGVFYRASTLEFALQHQLRGHAVNLPNGDVEVLACGSDLALSKLERWLWQGPALSQVTSVSASDVETPRPDGFRTG